MLQYLRAEDGIISVGINRYLCKIAGICCLDISLVYLPSWNGNPSRVRLRQFVESVANQIAPNALVLDAGAGEHSYAALFSHARYESADFEQDLIKLGRIGQYSVSEVT